MGESVLRIRVQDPVLFYPWIRDEFFPYPRSRIPDLFDYRYTKTKTLLLNDWKQEKSKFAFHFSFRIRDEKMFGGEFNSLFLKEFYTVPVLIPKLSQFVINILQE
jgi:hypothetical protein